MTICIIQHLFLEPSFCGNNWPVIVNKVIIHFTCFVPSSSMKVFFAIEMQDGVMIGFELTTSQQQIIHHNCETKTLVVNCFSHHYLFWRFALAINLFITLPLNVKWLSIFVFSLFCLSDVAVSGFFYFCPWTSTSLIPPLDGTK